MPILDVDVIILRREALRVQPRLLFARCQLLPRDVHGDDLRVLGFGPGEAASGGESGISG